MWALKILGIVVAVISLGLLGLALKAWRARRTIRNWAGTGINKELDPASAALLLGMNPSALVLLALTDLEIRGRLEISSPSPLRVIWSGGAPEGPVEKAIVSALDEEGAFSVDGIFAILEVLYERVNGEMAAYSGRETTVFYRQGAETMWQQFLDEGEDEPRVIPWLLLHRANVGWDRIGRGKEENMVREYLRRMNLAEQHLVPPEVYWRAVRTAKQGYFRYRRDLKVSMGPLTMHRS